MIGKMLGNRYELIEKIGEGGMGLVYKAKCHLLNRYVAIKILKPEFTEDEDFINRFKKESLSSASLSHPNIVSIYDVGNEDGLYYIVMEYVKGKTLKEIIKEKAPLSYYEIINISRQICLALEHAHMNNIIHRDIKPQNILITNDGIVKVADFGIARASDSATLTNTGNVIGSVYYISPEQARGGYTDEKTDLYSLGTVMYEMSTGRVPFMAESPVVIALKHIQDEVTKPSDINPKIPPALEDIILKCLEKNPADRYESAGALIKDLDRASAEPDTRIVHHVEDPNEATRVMPPIKEPLEPLEPSNDQITQDKKPEPKVRKTKYLIALVAVLITIGAISAMFAYMSSIRRNEVAVPDVIGSNVSDAELALKKIGLIPDVINVANDKPEGTVIDTDPSTGMMVKANSTVKLKVSAGSEQIKMPNLTGKTLAEANDILDSLGLTQGKVTEINDETVPKDNVIDQNPKPDSQVSKGSIVDITVSKGPEVKLVEVPSLEGYDYQKAEEILKSKNLKVGHVSRIYDPNRPNNIVTYQRIKAGTMMIEGSEIDLEINSTVPATS